MKRLPYLMKTKCVEVLRYQSVIYKNGIHQEMNPIKLSILAEIQPMSSEELVKLAEGDFNKEYVNIWTSSFLKVNDRFSYRGKLYRIIKVFDWYQYTKGVAVKEQECNGDNI